MSCPPIGPADEDKVTKRHCTPRLSICMNWPSEKQTTKAKRFGEGFTWTCPECGEKLVMTQGKGPHNWRWKNVP